MHGQYGLYMSNWPTLAWRQDNPRSLHDWRLSSGSPPPLLNSGWWTGIHASEPWYTLVIRDYILSGFAHNARVYDDGISVIPLSKRYSVPHNTYPGLAMHMHTHIHTCNRAPRPGCHASRQEPIGHTICLSVLVVVLSTAVHPLSCVVKTQNTSATFTAMFNGFPVKDFWII